MYGGVPPEADVVSVLQDPAQMVELADVFLVIDGGWVIVNTTATVALEASVTITVYEPGHNPLPIFEFGPAGIHW